MVRSFVGGLELIVSLLKSSDREVTTFNVFLILRKQHGINCI